MDKEIDKFFENEDLITSLLDDDDSLKEFLKSEENLKLVEEISKSNDNIILFKMDMTKKICQLGLKQRNEANIKVRQPLQSITVNKKLQGLIYEDIIKKELNIKQIIYK